MGAMRGAQAEWAAGIRQLLNEWDFIGRALYDGDANALRQQADDVVGRPVS